MRLLLVHASADMSTADVGSGLRAGLVDAGAEIVDYQLARRWKLAQAGFTAFCPDDQQPDMEMVALHASEGLAHTAATHVTPWALVISGMGLHPNALLALRRMGVKIAIRFTEAPYNTDDERELGLARLADVAFVNERTSVDTFQATLDAAGRGGRALYLGHAFDPAVHHPDAAGDAPLEEDERADVLLVGTGFAERCWLLDGIDWTGINLRIHGIWPGIQAPAHVYPFVRDGAIANRDTARLMRGAKIVLNPHRWHETAESAGPRTFEAAACGAFQIADARAELVELFGASVPTYTPQVPWQLAAQVRRWLADDHARLTLAAQARACVQPFTFAAQARTVLAALDAFDREHAAARSIPVATAA